MPPSYLQIFGMSRRRRRHPVRRPVQERVLPLPSWWEPERLTPPDSEVESSDTIAAAADSIGEVIQVGDVLDDDESGLDDVGGEVDATLPDFDHMLSGYLHDIGDALGDVLAPPRPKGWHP